MRLHVRGTVLPDSEGDGVRDLWVVDGRISWDPVADARTISDGGWILPGLVDAHCHIGIRYGGGHEDLDGARAQGRTEIAAGVLLVRDAGSPIDNSPLQSEPGMPTIIRAGRHLALPKRYIPQLGIDLEDESQLPEAAAKQARDGDGWVKLVGDWIDRSTGDLAPLWSFGALKQAVDASHAQGARVTAHVFGEDALPDLLNAGIDCIEHGCGLTDATIELMVARDVALVPTLINVVENFEAIADSATRYPTYAAHMRKLHSQIYDTIGAAHEAGVRIYAGTDAGGGIKHGRVADEVAHLARAGLSGSAAVAAASWAAREWLGAEPMVNHGTADFVVYRDDPRLDASALKAPVAVVLGGEVVSLSGPVASA